MLQLKPTKHFTGVTIQGDYYDFYELVDTIHYIVGGNEDEDDMYYGVKNRLLGLCFDIRHAYMGDRDVVLVENGMDEDLKEWHDVDAPFENVYYSVEILFPEALFIACSIPKMCYFASVDYGIKREEDFLQKSYIRYIKDKSNLNVLCAGIWEAFSTVVGEEESEKLYHMYERAFEDYQFYVTHYIDKCNIELIKTDLTKRKTKIKNIAKRIIKKPQAYYKMEHNLYYWAKEYETSIYQLEDPRLEYPEDFEW